MSGVSYLCLGGNEAANGNRALTYARAIGDPRVRVALRSPLIAEPSGPVPENLAAFCAAIEDDGRTAEDVTYLDPQTDPAPWYVASRDESAEFLGLHLTDVRIGSVISRPVTPRAPLGATVGPLHRAHRVVSFSGVMFASSERGMGYGVRWLNDVLTGTDCDRGSDATIFLACDPDSERVLPWAGILEPGLILGPLAQDVPDCLLQQASFQLVCPLPWLESPPVTLSTDPLTEPVTVTVTGPEWTGDVVVNLDLVSGGPDPVEGVVVAASYTDCDRPPFALCRIPALPANRTLRIDAARRSVVLTETSSGLVAGGMDAVEFSGLWRWIEAGPCTTVCVTVSATSVNTDTALTLTSVAREL